MSALIVVLILATWIKAWVENQNILETSMNTGGLPETVDLAQGEAGF